MKLGPRSRCAELAFEDIKSVEEEGWAIAKPHAIYSMYGWYDFLHWMLSFLNYKLSATEWIEVGACMDDPMDWR